MKKLLTILFLSASVLVAQELTADTVAADSGLLDQILKGLLIALMSFLTFLSTTLIPLANAWLKNIMHFRGSSVVADAIMQAFGELIAEVKLAAGDGVITKDEIGIIRTKAKKIALDKLLNLSGFYKKDLVKWLDEVLEVELGKFLSRILGSNSLSSAIH